MQKLTNVQRLILIEAAARADGSACAPIDIKPAAAGRLTDALVGSKVMKEQRSKADMLVWRTDPDGRATSLIITPAGKRLAATLEQEAPEQCESAPDEKTKDSPDRVQEMDRSDLESADAPDRAPSAGAADEADEPPNAPQMGEEAAAAQAIAEGEKSASPMSETETIPISETDPIGNDVEQRSLSSAEIRSLSAVAESDGPMTDALKVSQDAATASPVCQTAAFRPNTKQAKVVDLLSQPAGASLQALVDATGWLPHTTRAALTGLRKRGYVVLRITSKDGSGSIYRILGAEASAAA